MSKVSDPVAMKYEIPPHTCPLVDATISALEKVRDANEKLRDACANYFRDNRKLATDIATVNSCNESLIQENAELRITREYLESIKTSNPAIDTLVDLEVKLRLLITVEQHFEELFRVACDVINRNRLISKLSNETQRFIKATETTRKQKKQELLDSAIAKLTLNEIKALGIAVTDPRKKAFDADEDTDEA